MFHPYFYTAILSAAQITIALGKGNITIFNDVVELDYGSFQGNATNDLIRFLGIPFARPPLENLRFTPPQPPVPFLGVRQATSYGAACPQQISPIPNVLPFPLSVSQTTLTNISEDCLFINVIRPKVSVKGQRLPVLLWLFGGGFETGDSSINPGDNIVLRSIQLEEPIIHVSANYRLNAFGFLGGKEVKEAGIGNAGMRDQRFAMRWIQANIAQFGGDADQVTIWGESAGALSVGLHLVVNGGDSEGLFRAAVMESGGPYALRDISYGQIYYDQLVSFSGCTTALNTLQCLRKVPMRTLLAAVNTTPSVFNFTGLNLAWQPRIDGIIFQRNPQNSVVEDNFAKVPLLAGDCQDEGTFFSLGSTNITTNEEFLRYIHSNFFQGATENEITDIGEAYPQDPTQGSPFYTGSNNALTPQYKRLAAIQGDLIFQAPRRFILQYASRTQKSWAYSYQRGSTAPYIGAFHGSDLGEFFGAPGLADTGGPDFIGSDALIFFASRLDPNAPTGLPRNLSYLSDVKWETWGSSAQAPPLLTFSDPKPSLSFTADNYRLYSMQLVTNISRALVP